MNVIQGSMNGENLKIAIVTSEFNGFITEQLLKGAEHTLLKYGVTASNIDSLHVPGAFELPLAAKKLAETGRYDSVITLGCVIRGATSHYDYVCAEEEKGISIASLTSGHTMIFRVITMYMIV